MHPPETRYRLRFVTGERQGEVVPLHEGVVTLGRRADNTLVLPHGSVSGRHAEIRVSNGRVELADLGSTNGTRVSGRKIETTALAHGDEIVVGQIKFVFLDAELEDAEDAARESAESGLERVSVDKVQASGRRSRLGLLALGVVGALAILAFVWLRRAQSASGGPAVAAVVDGDSSLLFGSSFESDAPEREWSSAEAAPQSFVRERAAARTGRFGLGCELTTPDPPASIEWALASSPIFELEDDGPFTVRAALRSDGELEARLGVEFFLPGGSDDAGVIGWAPTRPPQPEGFEDVELVFQPPPSGDRARLLVSARGRGRVALDDVGVLADAPSVDVAANFNEMQVLLLGAPSSSAMLLRAGRPVFRSLQLGPLEPSGALGASWRVRTTEEGLVLQVDGEGADASFSIFIDENDIDLGGEDQAWIATSGPAGYQAHAFQFAREGATSLFLGRGSELVRLGFDQPVDLRGERRPQGLRLGVNLRENREFELQLSFVEERTEATVLSQRASEADRKGRAGQAIRTWVELLTRYPIERSQVVRAEEAVARLTSAGLDEVARLRAEFERARFFALPELFRQGIARCRALAERYEGSEVQVEAERLEAEIAAALSEVQTGGLDQESRLLSGVLQALDEQGQPQLSKHVSQALAQRQQMDREPDKAGKDDDGQDR